MRTVFAASILASILSGCGQTDPADDLASETSPPDDRLLVCKFSNQITIRKIPPICLDDNVRLTDTIQVENDYDEEIEVVEIGRSCSCTVPTFARAKLKPRESFELSAIINLPGTPGPWKYTLTPKTEDGRGCQITTSTLLFRRIEPEKESVRVLDLQVKETRRITFTVASCRLSCDPPQTLSMRAAQGRIAIAPGAVTNATTHGVVRQVHSFDLSLTADPDGRSAEDSLVISLDGNQAVPPVSVPILWAPAGEYELTPARAFLVVPPKATQPAKQTLVLKSRGGEFTPVLANPESIPTGIMVEFRRTAKSSAWLVDVSADPLRLDPKSHRFEVCVATGTAAASQFYLPITIYRDSASH